MKFLKGLALSLLSFLLFLSLSLFGLAFMLNSTLLNPKFVTSELNKLDMPSLVGEILSEETPTGESPQEFKATITNAMTKLEPLIEEKTSAAIYSIYDYLLGKSQSLDLALTLRSTIVSTDFVVSLVNEVDISFLAKEYLKKELAGEVPRDMAYLLDYLDDAINELKPWVGEQVEVVADPILSYLAGETHSFSIVISLETVKKILRDTVSEAFLKSPPPELAALPKAELEQYFDEFYQEFSGQIPSTFELNQSVLGVEVPAKIAKGLDQAEEALGQARQFVGYFQLGYKALIGFMVLLILCIILINREVRSTTRGLGTTFLTYGAFEYAGIFVAKYFTKTGLPLPEIPPSLQTWMPHFSDNLLAPLEMLSLGLLIGGLVLIIVSFVYKPSEPSH